MKLARLGAAALSLVLAATTAGSAMAASATPAIGGLGHPGLARLERAATTTAVTGIATFSDVSAIPAASQFTSLGLRAQPMKHLPLAIVQGPVAAMRLGVESGVFTDVYPNESVQLLDTTSSDSMGGAGARAAGYTGKGVTVAVVDSGCDATHPDLADHVIHNVKLIGKEYANNPPNPAVPGDGALVVPIELLPYTNSDLGSGHGTHVSGIIAADGTTGPGHMGVAPDASLICYSIGEILFTTAVISAYDHMLDQPGMWSIDVVNNSWGNLYNQYDPSNPVNVATKAVADRGAVVVFAAGNSGSDHGEASLNPWSMPPWVISVAAAQLDHKRASFSSTGLEYDNSKPVAIGAEGHTTFTGSRVGMYHPDVTAPGHLVSSSCTMTSTLTQPCPPNGNASASGTSMASPHVAGAAAVLRQANPKLSIEQVRQVMQVTATPLADGSPFWEAGYGHVNLTAAVKIARRSDFKTAIADRQASIDKKVLTASPYSVERSDFWLWTPPPVAAEGATDTKSFTVPVTSRTAALKVAIGHPSTANVEGNFMQYDVTVKDAAGKVVAQSTELTGTGTATAFVVLKTVAGGVKFGTWTVEVSGTQAVSDPDTLDSDSALGDAITLQLAQLRTK